MIHREPSPLPSVLSLCIKHRQRAVPGSRDPTLACVGSTSWPPGLAPSSLSVRRQRKQGWARRVLNERLPQEQALLCWVVCHSCAVAGRLPAPPSAHPPGPPTLLPGTGSLICRWGRHAEQQGRGSQANSCRFIHRSACQSQLHPPPPEGLPSRRQEANCTLFPAKGEPPRESPGPAVPPH